MLPDHVSHGGTYAGNRVAAAAAVKTLEIIRDTDVLETIHATGSRDPGGRARDDRGEGPAVPHHRPPLDVRHHVHRARRDRVPRLGDTDHELYDEVAFGMHARGAMPEPDSREPWFVCEAHAKGDMVDQVITAFERVARRGARRARAWASARHGRGRDVQAGRRVTGEREEAKPPMTLDGNAVRSVDRAAALLLALGEAQGEAGVTELARRLGLHKSTASRLLATLEKRGLVEQDDETGKYRLGIIVLRLAETAERTLDLRSIAMPELDRLARATRETTGLGVLDGDRFLTVAQADGPNLVAMGDWTGRSVPPHSVAAGKVLMAALPEREIMRLVRRGLDQLTDRTITQLEPLLEELARVRRRGYATAFGEYDAGLNAVAAPVYDARGQVAAAVDVWGPSFRRHARAGAGARRQQIRASAAAVSVRLGGTAA